MERLKSLVSFFSYSRSEVKSTTKSEALETIEAIEAGQYCVPTKLLVANRQQNEERKKASNAPAVAVPFEHVYKYQSHFNTVRKNNMGPYIISPTSPILSHKRSDMDNMIDESIINESFPLMPNVLSPPVHRR